MLWNYYKHFSGSDSEAGGSYSYHARIYTSLLVEQQHRAARSREATFSHLRAAPLAALLTGCSWSDTNTQAPSSSSEPFRRFAFISPGC